MGERSHWPNRIQEWRISSGLSFRQIAATCEPPTTAAQIQKLERGERQLDLIWMRRIAKAFAIKPSELLNAEDVECRLSVSEAALLDEMRSIQDSDPMLLMAAVKAVLRAMVHLRETADVKAKLPGDPAIAGQLADIWADLDDTQRSRAIELVQMSRNFTAGPRARAA